MWASEELVALWQRKNRLQKALKPFKYLNRNCEVGKFRDVWREEVKFAEVVTDVSEFHHDIDGLRLEHRNGVWELEVLLKKRDPESDWEEWIKDGRDIVREWVTAYRFDSLGEATSGYYQVVFPVLSEFEKTGRFPGGKTRTTKKKLELAKVPVLDEDARLEPLIELKQEWDEVSERIVEVDALVEQWVYEVYGLSEEDIAVAEE